MKTALLCSLFPFLSFGQTDTISLVKSYNYHPIIANTQLGGIAYWKLCDSVGLHTKEACTVLSFDLSYFGKQGWTESHIVGNTIPDNICTEIGVYGLNNDVFFTNIKAMLHDTFRVIYLTPMNLVPLRTNE